MFHGHTNKRYIFHLENVRLSMYLSPQVISCINHWIYAFMDFLLIRYVQFWNRWLKVSLPHCIYSICISIVCFFALWFWHLCLMNIIFLNWIFVIYEYYVLNCIFLSYTVSFLILFSVLSPNFLLTSVLPPFCLFFWYLFGILFPIFLCHFMYFSSKQHIHGFLFLTLTVFIFYWVNSV